MIAAVAEGETLIHDWVYENREKMLGTAPSRIDDRRWTIALAALIMGRWHPIGAASAGLFFGFMWNLQNQLSFAGKLPTELLGAAPYLATIIAVAGFVGRVRPPAADGEPYVKS